MIWASEGGREIPRNTDILGSPSRSPVSEEGKQAGRQLDRQAKDAVTQDDIH
jgi:hypothetical protein